MQMKSQTLAKIDEAVRRLEKGRYGECTEQGRSGGAVCLALFGWPGAASARTERAGRGRYEPAPSRARRRSFRPGAEARVGPPGERKEK